MRDRTPSILVILAFFLAFFLTVSGSARATTLHFSGYDWTVKSGDGLGPGPCNWSDSNVWVDANGDLHLKISNVDGTWYCSEIESLQRLGFGEYQFTVIGAIDMLDPNVVLGLFNYPTPDVGSDRTNEIDIEIARWGNPAAPNLNFTVWPARAGLPPVGKSYFFSLQGTYTTQRFTWRKSNILFRSLNGHRNDNRSTIAKWSDAPANASKRIPQKPLPVHLNLWLVDGKPPTDGQEVEIVIRSFTYKP